jgi:hypothetical protein
VFARLLSAAAAAASIAMFSSQDVVQIQLKAPLNELFDNARTDEDYSVDGTLSYTDNGRPVTVENVKVSLRGHTSRRQTECTFPKLKVSFPDGAAPNAPLFAGMDAVKLGTHCGEAPEDAVSMKYGRLPNEQSPHREAFVYRLLAVLDVPTLQARPARVTYVYTDPKPGQTPPQDRPLVRNAMIIEDDDDAIARLGGRGEITEEEFSNARAMFTAADTATVAFAEALIGNFDWCLKMTADDRYRCDARHPLWNITAAKMPGGKARPIVHDFDVSGMVAGRHPWFKDVFPQSFGPVRSQTEIDVLAQVQRTRSLFGRDELNAARARFTARKDDAYRTLDGATLDAAGKEHARRYMDAFYGAIASDQAFYRPVVAAPETAMYATADGTPACQNAGAIPVGTPVSDPIQTSGALIQVQLLDALWHWSSGARCDAVRKGPVWIKADAVSADYPKP